MQLYYSLTSPYARKVRMVLLEKGLPFDGINVAESEHQATERNPLGKVPTLVLDDGFELFDSVVIVETLEALHPAPQLIPEDPRCRAQVRRWEALADGLCDVLIPVVVDSLRPVEVRNVPYTTKLENKVRTVLQHIDRELTDRLYLFSSVFTLADAAVISSLGYVNLRRPELLGGLSQIARYQREMSERPSVSRTIPPNLPART